MPARTIRRPKTRPWLIMLVAALIGGYGLITTVRAQSPDLKQLTDLTSGWNFLLERIEKELKEARLNDQVLSKMGTELEDISIKIQQFITKNKPLANDAKTLLDKLGPPPKEGEPAEADAVARQRAELTERFKQTDGAIRSATSLRARAEQIRKVVHDERRNLFAREILKKGKSPFLLSLWHEGLPKLSLSLLRLGDTLENWAGRNSVGKLSALFLISVLVGLVLFLIMRKAIAAYRTYPEGPPPPFFKKASSAAVVSLMRAAPPLTGALICYGGMHYMDMLNYPVEKLASIALAAFSAVAAIGALSTTLLAPKRPIWRIFPVSGRAARRLNMLIGLIAAIYGLDLFVNAVNQTLLMPLSVTVLQSAVASLIFAGLLIAVLRTPIKTHRLGGTGKMSTIIHFVRLPLWIIVFTVLLATALGYISLARFITHQTVIMGSVFIVLYLAYLSIGEFTENFGDPKYPAGHFLSTKFGISQQRREQLGAITMLLMNGLLILLTVPVLALQWGFSWNDVHAWSRKLLFGFEFGGLHISLAAVLIAISIFFAGVLLTKIFQRWLDQKILSKGRSQTGAEDSIKTAFGYLGIVVSALIAISYTGIGFSNIAIVAGALSVGIGFGLQSIVNNFVSGLILLAERPIKVGDWISVGTDEGNVRRISVRSTEIETFDRSHIIVPNSELISGTVKNWTLRGPLGRIVIKVGVSYDADPEQVKEILLRLAKEHEAILEYPAAYVVFEDFGNSSLDFSLRAFLSDINKSLTVRSQLRFAIFKAFQDAGIEIPYPQTDLHLRDMDRLEQALKPSPPPRNRKRRPRHQKNAPQNSPQKAGEALEPNPPKKT